ncbi:MAG: hypothetical protein V1918_06320 [Planctomycetota bacterium]
MGMEIKRTYFFLDFVLRIIRLIGNVNYVFVNGKARNGAGKKDIRATAREGKEKETAMPNIAKVLREEIRRLARKEAKSAVVEVRREQLALKRSAGLLQRRLARLEKKKGPLSIKARAAKAVGKHAAPEKLPQLRMTAKSILALRNKLKLSQALLGKLLGVSTHAVWQWEQKKAPLKLRNKTKQALLDVRKLKAREAKRRLADME